MSASNYPPGSDTPDAPWNKRDCPECEGTGCLSDELDNDEACPECDGSGILTKKEKKYDNDEH